MKVDGCVVAAMHEPGDVGRLDQRPAGWQKLPAALPWHRKCRQYLQLPAALALPAPGIVVVLEQEKVHADGAPRILRRRRHVFQVAGPNQLLQLMEKGQL